VTDKETYNLFESEPKPDLWQHATREGDPRFLALLDEIESLHAVKQRDYGTSVDPFANVRGSQEWGVEPWVGAMIRATDKVRRLQTYANKGTLANEGVEDSLLDLAVYSLIALVLFREPKVGVKPSPEPVSYPFEFVCEVRDCICKEPKHEQ
jgi:hypothetical protein